jgi:ribA/ribD-fused uncharacterized protein
MASPKPTTNAIGDGMDGTDSKIPSFDGIHRFLSNFFPAKLTVTFDGLDTTTKAAKYNTAKCANAEQAYQYAKAVFAHNYTTATEILAAATPTDAKRLGRTKMGLDMAAWDAKKDEVMLAIVRAKFAQNPDLARKLLDTQDAYLEEGNTWGDTYWGTCQGKGKNMLGKILMQVREEIRSANQ